MHLLTNVTERVGESTIVVVGEQAASALRIPRSLHYIYPLGCMPFRECARSERVSVSSTKGVNDQLYFFA